MPDQMHTLEPKRQQKLVQAFHLRRIAVGSTIYPGACAPARLIWRYDTVTLGQRLGKTVPAVGRRTKSMQQHNGLTLAALRINNSMVANLDYTALQSGSKTFQADQHGCKVCHDFYSSIVTRYV